MLNEEVNDTDPDTERMMIGLWQQAPTWRKLQQVSMLNEMLDSLILANIVKRYPNADDTEVRRHLAKRKLPPDLYQKYFGEDGEAR